MKSFSHDIEDYPEGIILNIDKPYRWTSADVIRKIKYAAIRHFGKKKLKVGHAGTLDPLATGVLLVCIGPATKRAEELQKHDKEYVAGVSFGATTPSFDLEKGIDARFPCSHIEKESVEEALKAFIGEQMQVAPLFSAKSVDGVRAYELARKAFKAGEAIPEGLLRAARINISECELLDFRKSAAEPEAPDFGRNATEQETGGAEKRTGGASFRINVAEDDPELPHAKIRIACSKGTYIRAFARDLGEALGSGAYLNSLCRSRSGAFRVEDALTVEQALSLLSVSSEPER
ncbi:MAG: tRNA pseudouridine(55) synthase TruB [Candidatus Cryptobacteroides sp.]|nr:tRNA pseudouridine(55) synthase TruB [Candidatus Cryptobacteroides sp.]